MKKNRKLNKARLLGRRCRVCSGIASLRGPGRRHKNGRK